MPDVPGDEFYRDLPLHASRQSDHRLMAAEDRPELPHGAVLADLFRRSRSTERLWVCCREDGKKQQKMRNRSKVFDPDPYLEALDKYGLPRRENRSPELVD